jgi:hypothetical protein
MMGPLVVKNVAGSGVKWVDVAPGRFPGWIASFAVRHGDPVTVLPPAGPAGAMVTFRGADGVAAECHPPFPESFTRPDAADPSELAAAVAAHAAAPRNVGVLLVRLGGYAAGVFAGYPPALVDSKTGSRLVQGRSAAGGWSQQRFARRREKQASEAIAAAAGTAVAVFGRWAGRGGALDAVVLGGDKRTAAELRDDPRLAPYLALATARFITVPDPRRAVLEGAPAQFTAVRIKLSPPGE